jgi:hypothetical protein
MTKPTSNAKSKAKPNRKVIALGKLADDYGTLKGKIKDLEDLLFLIRGQIIESGLSEIEGILFRITIADVEKCTLDTASLRDEYPDVAKQFERITHSIVVRCNSR